MRTLPIPIEFELPGPAWRPVQPESLGVENAAFLAVREGDPDYDPTITVSGGWRDDPATLDQIADESLAKIRGQATDVELLKRQDITSEHAPAVVQSIGAVATMNGRTFDLRQAQVVAAYVDVADATRRVVVIYTLTCTFAQWERIGPEFETFMATVRVVPEAEAS